MLEAEDAIPACALEMPPSTRLSRADDTAAPTRRLRYTEIASDEDEYELVGARRRRKRDADGRPVGVARKPAKKRRRARSSMPHSYGGLLSCPTEILTAVFSQLDHEDLDALTHTSRALRSLLLTRATGLAVYRRVFARLFETGLAVPPPEVSLPAYASMLSLTTCTVLSRRIGLRLMVQTCGK